MNGPVAVRREPVRPSFPVLFEDEHFVVFDKPAGLLVIPSPKREKNTMVDRVNVPGLPYRLHPCHRLDRETSGAIIFAKGKENQQRMMDLFHQQAVSKKYIAFVHGKMRHPAGEIKVPVEDFHRKKFHPQGRPQPALTRYKVLTVKHRFSVAEVTPVTGRTNQIRIHMSHIGHPLLGERMYTLAREFELKFRRVALHSAELEWKHPVTKKMIHVTAPLADDMDEFLGRY